MTKEKYGNKLKDSNLKVTPQRTAVLEALDNLKDHPTADKIKEYVVKNNPNIAVGTIYKTLETFVEKGMVNRVKTEEGVMRYDAILDRHHHLYCEETKRIEDFFDDELNEILIKYFEKKKISNFAIKDIKLQIIGTFDSKKN